MVETRFSILLRPKFLSSGIIELINTFVERLFVGVLEKSRADRNIPGFFGTILEVLGAFLNRPMRIAKDES